MENEGQIEKLLQNHSQYLKDQIPKMKFGYEHHKEKCSQCGRRILVQIILNGTSHNIGVGVVCADCLAKIGVGEEFRMEHPEEAQDIENWLHG